MEIKKDGVYVNNGTVEYTVDLADAELAIKKSVPVYPIYKKIKLLGRYHKVAYCPFCGDDWNLNEFNTDVKYCWNCGQHIDWRNNELEDGRY